jgi:hypothetical protein
MAGSAALRADDPTQGEASLLATILFGVWWWIRGAPIDGEPGVSLSDKSPSK